MAIPFSSYVGIDPRSVCYLPVLAQHRPLQFRPQCRHLASEMVRVRSERKQMWCGSRKSCMQVYGKRTGRSNRLGEVGQSRQFKLSQIHVGLEELFAHSLLVKVTKVSGLRKEDRWRRELICLIATNDAEKKAWAHGNRRYYRFFS